MKHTHAAWKMRNWKMQHKTAGWKKWGHLMRRVWEQLKPGLLLITVTGRCVRYVLLMSNDSNDLEWRQLTGWNALLCYIVHMYTYTQTGMMTNDIGTAADICILTCHRNEWVSELSWVLRAAQHIIDRFEDVSFQAITSTGTDNLK